MDVKTVYVLVCIQETVLNSKARHYLSGKSWKMRLQDNGPKKQACVGILSSNNLDFKSKLIRRCKRTLQEDIAVPMSMFQTQGHLSSQNKH